MELYNNIQEQLKDKNINVAVGSLYDMMAIWKEWYRGNVNDFHHRKVFMANGSTKDTEILTMNMAKKIASDFAKLLYTEKTKITLGTEEQTKMLWDILDSKENSFSVNFPQFIERYFALGSGALVEYQQNGRTIIDYVDGDVILPYKFINSYISGLITVSRSQEKKQGKDVYYTRLTYHEYADGMYTVYNELYESDSSNVLGKEIDFASKYPDVQNPFTIETDTPFFQIFKPNNANNFDTDNPLGISIFANAIDNLKALDIKFDSLTREFITGKKRIIVDASTLKARVTTDSSGEQKFVKYFDENDESFVAVTGVDNQPIKEIDFNLRVNEHIEAINTELSWLSANVGLGNNFYKFDGSGLKTATEVMSENSDTFRSKCHHQIIVNDCLYDLVKSICILNGLDYSSINIVADDSIIEDTDTVRKRDREDVSMGVMSKAEYRAKWYGETLEDAESKLPQTADILE